MEHLQTKFNSIITNFKNELEQFKAENKLDDGNIIIEIKPSMNSMIDGYGNRIPNVGFIPQIEFILAENR